MLELVGCNTGGNPVSVDGLMLGGDVLGRVIFTRALGSGRSGGHDGAAIESNENQKVEAC